MKEIMMRNTTPSRWSHGRRSLVALGVAMSIGLSGCGFLDALDKAVKELVAGGIAFDSAGNVDVAGVRVNDFGRAVERYDQNQKNLDTTDKNIAEFIRNRDGKAVGDAVGPFEEGKKLDQSLGTGSNPASSLVRVTDDDGKLYEVDLKDVAAANANLEIRQVDETVEDLGEEDKEGKVLRGRRVANRYEFVLATTRSLLICDGPADSCARQAAQLPPPDKVVVAYATMEKTWYYDGTRVVGADGKNPPKAKVTVDATKFGAGIGYKPLGIVGGSQIDEYVQLDGQPAAPGQQAHESAATVAIQWSVPVAANILNLIGQEPVWQQELKIIVDKDGNRQCRGGTSCKFVTDFP